MQGVFEHVKGVRQVVAGYSGGARNTATYERVSEGDTGHAESVQITFDPRQVTYGEILRIFFSVAHDPTELNRQGPDSGTNYRSDIFFADSMQERIALAYIAQLDSAHVFSVPIVTRVDRLSGFYPAENYHQDYLVHNPDSMYIVVNDLPKITNLKRIYPALYRDPPVLVSAHAPA
jgi:peptide-methionine (S)-S-oxide reductase